MGRTAALNEGLGHCRGVYVAILDADKEGFLRSERSLIQTIGRAARHLSGRAILYADRMTDSMRQALDETGRRREIQEAYNREHGIDPTSIRKKVSDILLGGAAADPDARERRRSKKREELPTEELERLIRSLEEEMHEAAKDLKFEYAARIRDEVVDLRKELKRLREAGVPG